MIGFSVSSAVARPNSTLPEDAYATEAFNFFENGLLLHPIVFGDYPDIVKRTAKEKLPVFTEEEKSMLQSKCWINAPFKLTIEVKTRVTLC